MSKSKKSYSALGKNKIKPLILTSVIAVVAIIAVVIVLIFCFKSNPAKTDYSDIIGTWVPYSANNASGDQVDLAEIYHTSYTNYKGSITFNDESTKTFDFWLTPGIPDDGTHTGKYEIKSSDTIKASFDDGTVTNFKIVRSDNKISYILINYNDYKIQFVKQED